MRRPDLATLAPDLSVVHLWRWLFAPGSPRMLAAVRIGLSIVLAVQLGLRPGFYLSLAGQPPALFAPTGVTQLLTQMPSRGVILALVVAGTLTALMSAAGLAARFTLPAAWLCGTLLEGLVNSQGKVIHNNLLLLLCLLCLIPARHSDVWSLEAWLARRRRPSRETPPQTSALYGWPVRLAMLTIALAYFFTGLHKLEFSGPGLTWATSGNLRWVLYIASDNQHGNTLALWLADHAALTHLFAVATLILELGFPLVLVLPWARWLFVPGIVGMHASIYATMHLNYFAMAATVVVVFTDWPRLVSWLRRRSRGPADPREAVAAPV